MRKAGFPASHGVRLSPARGARPAPVAGSAALAVQGAFNIRPSFFKSNQISCIGTTPRVRGEDGCDAFLGYSLQGLPPRARGRLYRGTPRPLGERTTPACAGKTPVVGSASSTKARSVASARTPAMAGLRMAKVGAATTGGNRPRTALRQFRRDAGVAGMILCADMMDDQPHDTFAIGGGQTLARIGKPFGKAVDPQPHVRVQHHLDHGGVFEQSRDCWPQCRAQHTCAACNVASGLW